MKKFFSIRFNANSYNAMLISIALFCPIFIFSPTVIESSESLAFQQISKFEHSSFLGGEQTLKRNEIILSESARFFGKYLYCRNEGIIKSAIDIVMPFFSVSMKSEPMSSNYAKKENNKSDRPSNIVRENGDHWWPLIFAAIMIIMQMFIDRH